MKRRKKNVYFDGIKKGLDEAVAWSDGRDVPVVVRTVSFPSMTKTRRNLKPVHPGEILRKEFMLPAGVSRNRLSSMTHLSTRRISAILSETSPITEDEALRLGRHFKTTARFWMNLQSRYEKEIAEAKTR